MSAPDVAIRPAQPGDLPALLETWARHQARAAGTIAQEPWERALDARRPFAERALRPYLAGERANARALVATRGDAIAAYLGARALHLPPDSAYRAYAPDDFLLTGPDEWGLADPADADLLARLYGELASWGLARGATGQTIAVPASVAATAEPWLELGFARQDRYAYLPLAAVRPGRDDVLVRRAGPADLDVATRLVVAEAAYHHGPPIFAFAPPGLAEAKRRDLEEALADPDAFIFLAEAKGRVVGGLTTYYQAELPFWMPSATPTPCAYIDSGFVDPVARGRGVLHALLCALADGVTARGGRGLFVTYLPANRLATRAWTALGFRPVVTIHQRRLDPRAIAQLRDAPPS